MKRIILLLLILVCGCCGGREYDSFSPDTPGFDNLPRNLSWANVDLNGDGVGENYVTSIKNQPCSDCYVHGAIGLLEIQYQIDHRVNVSLNLSEQNIHNCLRIACHVGGDDRPLYEYFKKFGALNEEYSQSGHWALCENCWKTFDVRRVPFYKINAWRQVVSPEMSYQDRKYALLFALQTGPVSIHTKWGYKSENGILRCVDEKAGGHVVIIIGYTNHGETFIIKNSHGESGFLQIVFEGSDKCDFATVANQIMPGTTYTQWGAGIDFCYSMNDNDGDKIVDTYDNCPYKSNLDQKNTDGDLFGDACDACPENPDNSCRPQKKVDKVSKSSWFGPNVYWPN